MTSQTTRIAGWYDDDRDAALLRYWDGAKWSPHTAPKPTDAADGLVATAVDEVTKVRHPEEHTTVPLPAEHPDPAASAAGHSREQSDAGFGHRIAWIVVGAVIAVGVVAGGIAGLVGVVGLLGTR